MFPFRFPIQPFWFPVFSSTGVCRAFGIGAAVVRERVHEHIRIRDVFRAQGNIREQVEFGSLGCLMTRSWDVVGFWCQRIGFRNPAMPELDSQATGPQPRWNHAAGILALADGCTSTVAA